MSLDINNNNNTIIIETHIETINICKRYNCVVIK